MNKEDVEEPQIANPSFEKELESLINLHCKESESSTPDFILAEYLVNCLNAFNKCEKERSKWHSN